MNTTIRHRLVELLTNATQATVFSRAGGGYTAADHYGAMWSSDPRSEGLSAYTMVEPSGVDEFHETVATALGRFVGERDGNTVVYSNIGAILGGSDDIPLGRFCNMLILAAVRTSPERVADLLDSWLGGEPIRRMHVFVLHGLSMEDDKLSLTPHISMGRIPRVSRIPEDVRDLEKALDVPEGLIGSHPLSNKSVDGRLALFHDLAIGPVFRDPDDYEMKNQFEDHAIVGIGKYGWDTHHVLRWSLSVACNARVIKVADWCFTPDLDVRAFSTYLECGSRGSRGSLTREYLHDLKFTFNSNGEDRTVDISGKLDAESLALAGRLATALSENQLGERTRAALDAWISSLPIYISNQASHYWNARVAFDRLFGPDGGSGEITHRISSRCARFLEADMHKRKELYRRVKSIYGTASRFAHDSSVKEKPKQVRDIQDARCILRRCILRIIDDGCADPDLDSIDFA